MEKSIEDVSNLKNLIKKQKHNKKSKDKKKDKKKKEKKKLKENKKSKYIENEENKEKKKEKENENDNDNEKEKKKESLRNDKKRKSEDNIDNNNNKKQKQSKIVNSEIIENDNNSNNTIPNNISLFNQSTMSKDITYNSNYIDNNKKNNDNNDNTNDVNDNNVKNKNQDKKTIIKLREFHYKINKEAENELKKEYDAAPVELTDRWRNSQNLKENGLSDIMKKGPFSNDEKKTLKNAVYNYLELNNIDKSLVLNLVFKKQYKDDNALDPKQHRDFWKYVSQSLPNRSLESSYRCVTRMFHPDNFNGKFTDNDDKMIIRLYALYGPSWKKIGEMIGRMGTAVKDRYQLLQKRNFSGEGVWSEEESKLFVEIIQDMKKNNKFVNGMPVFSVLSERMKTRSPKQCYVHWISSKDDFVNGNKCPFTIFDRQEYLEKLSKLKVQDETQVNWKKVTNPSKPWSLRIYSRDWMITKKRYLNDIDYKDKTFIECVNFILKKVNSLIIDLVNESNQNIVVEDNEELNYNINQSDE